MQERRPKGLTSVQEKEYDEIIKTFPNYEFSDYLTLARLRRKKVFPYAKSDRLYRQISEKIIQSWKDIGDFFHYLPESYQKEIISSRAFESLFNTQILISLEQQVSKKKRQRKLNQAEIPEEKLFQLYWSFFKIGYVGLIKMMPDEFNIFLSSQINPSMELISSVISYQKRMNPKRKSLKDYGFEPREIGV